MHIWIIKEKWKNKQTNKKKKLVIELPNDPVVLLLGIYPKEREIGCNRDICTLMSIAALFTTAKLWKWPRCPTADEWIMKLWYIYTVEYYSATSLQISWWEDTEERLRKALLLGVILCALLISSRNFQSILSLLCIRIFCYCV
jgi:hypothetical protein